MPLSGNLWRSLNIKDSTISRNTNKSYSIRGLLSVNNLAGLILIGYVIRDADCNSVINFNALTKSNVQTLILCTGKYMKKVCECRIWLRRLFRKYSSLLNGITK